MPEIITDQGLLVAELLSENIQKKNKHTSTKNPKKVVLKSIFTLFEQP